jgi:hypothetical protein
MSNTFPKGSSYSIEIFLQKAKNGRRETAQTRTHPGAGKPGRAWLLPYACIHNGAFC